MVQSASEAKVIKVDTQSFIHENTGNIKDFYKISSCIGRGKRPAWILLEGFKMSVLFYIESCFYSKDWLGSIF